MSLALLDGTDASVDLNLAISGTGYSMRCLIGAMEYRSTRGFQSAKTLCSSKWESELPGSNQDFIQISKFGSKGTNQSDLSSLMTAVTPAAVTATFFTGCTKVGTFWLSDDSIGVVAGFVPMPGAMVLRSKDAVATVWVTT